MPITIDLTDHALYKKGAKDSEIKTKRTAIINMLKRGMPIKDIAEIQEVSIDYVIQIQNELDKKQAVTQQLHVLSKLRKLDKETIKVSNLLKIKNR